jgi:hypothetical protein
MRNGFSLFLIRDLYEIDGEKPRIEILVSRSLEDDFVWLADNAKSSNATT